MWFPITLLIAIATVTALPARCLYNQARMDDYANLAYRHLSGTAFLLPTHNRALVVATYIFLYVMLSTIFAFCLKG